jgi:ceroid-lipofuscinosis MFS transporter 7
MRQNDYQFADYFFTNNSGSSRSSNSSHGVPQQQQQQQAIFIENSNKQHHHQQHTQVQQQSTLHSIPFQQQKEVLLNHEYLNDDDNRTIHIRVNDDGDDASVSSVLTADCIVDATSFRCICLVIFVGDMGRGILFPSLWPLVQSLGGDQVVLGYAVAAFSLGRVLVNPLFGGWSHTRGYTWTLVLACCILFTGTLVYAQVPTVNHPYFLLLAQLLLGVGSGTLGVTRAYVAQVTATRYRTKYMGWCTAVQYAGFTVTPIFGAFFNYVLGTSEYRLFGCIWLRWNMYTAPAWFMCFTVTTTIAVLVLFFTDPATMEDTTTMDPETTTDNTACVTPRPRTKRRQAVDLIANSAVCLRLSVYDCCILGCMLLNVSTKGSIASFETLGIAIAESHFDMVSSRAGLIVASCGALGVAALLGMGHLSYYMTDIQMITSGMVVMSCGIFSLMFVHNPDAVDALRNPSWRYALAMFLIYSIGYPIGHTAVIGLFSKGT